MTLKGPNDFKLEDFYSASSELFEPYYGRDTEEGAGRYEGSPARHFRLAAAVTHVHVFFPQPFGLGFPHPVGRASSLLVTLGLLYSG